MNNPFYCVIVLLMTKEAIERKGQRKPSRRDFLKMIPPTLAAIYLAACGERKPKIRPDNEAPFPDIFNSLVRGVTSLTPQEVQTIIIDDPFYTGKAYVPNPTQVKARAWKCQYDDDEVGEVNAVIYEVVKEDKVLAGLGGFKGWKENLLTTMTREDPGLRTGQHKTNLWVRDYKTYPHGDGVGNPFDLGKQPIIFVAMNRG